MRHGSTEASIGTNVQSPIHCSKGILSGTVFSTQMCSLPDDTDDDDDSMLIIVHFQSLYCGLCLICGLTSGRHTLAATWRHRGWCWRWWCRLYLDTKHWEQFPVFLQIPPATLNLVFSSLASELSWEEREGGEGKLSSRAAGHSEIDGAESSSSKSRLAGNTCLKSAQFCVSIRLLFLFTLCVIFCLNNHIVTMLRVQWKDFLRRYWIITNSDQPLADCLSDISLFGYKCWLDPGQAHCHWGPGLSALSWSPDPLESVLFWDRGEVFSPVRLGSGGIRPSFIRFFCFILRFWNQIFTWKATRVSKNILDQFYAHLFLSHSERRVLGNIYLSFIQLKRRCNLYPSRPRQIFIKVKFLLEFC